MNEPDDRTMILNPSRWPNRTVLPLTRRDPKAAPGSFPVCGLITADRAKPDDPFTVYEVNMFSLAWDGPGDMKNVPRHVYKDVDDLLADGWRVD